RRTDGERAPEPHVGRPDLLFGDGRARYPARTRGTGGGARKNRLRRAAAPRTAIHARGVVRALRALRARLAIRLCARGRRSRRAGARRADAPVRGDGAGESVRVRTARARPAARAPRALCGRSGRGGFRAVTTARIDGQSVVLRDGDTILTAAQRLGIALPVLCHVDGLAPEGACRLCVVEVEGAPHPLAACHTALAPGTVVRTETPAIAALRRDVLRLYVESHPGLDARVASTPFG